MSELTAFVSNVEFKQPTADLYDYGIGMTRKMVTGDPEITLKFTAKSGEELSSILRSINDTGMLRISAVEKLDVITATESVAIATSKDIQGEHAGRW